MIRFVFCQQDGKRKIDHGDVSRRRFEDITRGDESCVRNDRMAGVNIRRNARISQTSSGLPGNVIGFLNKVRSPDIHGGVSLRFR